jgi:hypothetical protein
MYYSLQENGPWTTCGEEDNTYQNSTFCNAPFFEDYLEDDAYYYYDDYYYDQVYYNADHFIDSQKDNNKWLSASDECSWFGIYCNSDGSVFATYIGELT